MVYRQSPFPYSCEKKWHWHILINSPPLHFPGSTEETHLPNVGQMRYQKASSLGSHTATIQGNELS